MPDGIIIVGSNMFRCPEVLCQASLTSKDSAGVHDKTFLIITKCDLDIRKDLYDKVVRSCGTMMYPGIGEQVYLSGPTL